MVTEVRDHGFDDLTESRILSFLNDAYFDICSREPWPFLEKTATLTINSSGVVTSPTDIHQVLSVVDTTNEVTLTPQRLDDIGDGGRNLTLAGNAEHYYFIGDSMYLYPVPSGVTYRVNYIRYPAALTTTPDSSPILPTHGHRLLVVGALAKASVMEDDPDLAAVYTNMFETRLSQVRNALWRKQYDRPEVIKDMFWEDDVDWLY